ncbi:hypothetical protein Taro_009247 [Colocasia esculenta]|uniref:Uncharacterized protein n=1 Tax=Colocasia esculenta TaxID=4460 RepID=A0A843U558_COLES|nr:hypothetical protein [Colocasia esculenta]
MISPIPRFFASSDSLDCANRWRSPHAKPPSHSDWKSCSTPREISSPESALRDGRKGTGFAEFRYGAKIPPECVYYNTDCHTLQSDVDICSLGVRNRPRGPKSESALRLGR